MRIREYDQRCADGNQYEVYSDGSFDAEYRVTSITDGRIVTREVFHGETALVDAERRFTEDVIRVIHGGQWVRGW